ncbi:hypothetical protein AGMMS50276_24380 [Synergistales bacterium]|nr:hypothetical protein AGMMS50276_24380 [Synergistales bacterium]
MKKNGFAPFGFLFIFFFMFLTFVMSASITYAADTDKTIWTWDVYVIPPDSGWESDYGVSVERALKWHEAEVSDSGNGIQGHDLNFILLPPLTEDSAASFSLPPAPHPVAVFSFASDIVDKILVNRVTSLPLLLAGGETVFFFERSKRVLPNVFALDLFRDFRSGVFADYAAKTMSKSPGARIGVLGARFTLHEEREAGICSDLLRKYGFMPLPFWSDASVTDAFGMVENEIKGYSNGVLISAIGSMGTKEVWRGIMGHRSPYQIWYMGSPDRSFLSCRGMIFTDQNMYLEERGGFENVKREFWTTRTLAVTNKTGAGRANALAVWLIKSLEKIPDAIKREDADRGVLLALLAEAKDIPFGNQTLNIDRYTHRPEKRRVSILEVRNKIFAVLDTMDANGLRYIDE